MFSHCVYICTVQRCICFYLFDGFINPLPRKRKACDGKAIILHYEACSTGHMHCKQAPHSDFFSRVSSLLFCN